MSRRVRLLIDKCLHTSLVRVATDRLYEAYHVAHLGMSGLKDHELMLRIRDEDFTLVTNNATDFRRLFRKEQIHPGLVIIVPNSGLGRLVNLRRDQMIVKARRAAEQ